MNVEYARQGMGESPLVLTKIEPPRLRPGHIARGELVERQPREGDIVLHAEPLR